MRADARRNYDRLVNAARQVFAKYGGGASMEAIAKEAGVGIGTLYRHFPKRIDIVEAVYRADVDELIRTAEELTDQEPWPGLVAWLRPSSATPKASGSSTSSMRPLRRTPTPAFRRHGNESRALWPCAHAGQEAGVVRTDVGGPDLMQLLGSMRIGGDPDLGRERPVAPISRTASAAPHRSRVVYSARRRGRPYPVTALRRGSTHPGRGKWQVSPFG